MMDISSDAIPASHYRALAEFRYQVRKFLQFSEKAAREAGVEPGQHQALLALRALPASARPCIGELAQCLLLRHHSAVDLVDRMERRGLVARDRDGRDRRQVRLRITPEGEGVLRRLTVCHRAELRAAAPALARALADVLREADTGGELEVDAHEGA